MESLALRDPVSALSHVPGFLAGLYLTLLFWRLTRKDRLRRASTVCFGVSITLLYGASAAYHAVLGPPDLVRFLQKLDHSAIYVLIAGTYTPIFALALRGRMRRFMLTGMWSLALVGILLKWLMPLGPYTVSVGLYLAMGWFGVVPAAHLRRSLGWRGLFLGLLGGLIYTLGGVCDAVGWPTVHPLLFRSHEMMHLCDLLATATHVAFILGHVLPCRVGRQVNPGRLLPAPQPA